MDGSGGSGSGAVLRRLHQMIATLPTSKPTIHAGPSTGVSQCDVCGQRIEVGAVEYEAQFDGLIVRLDRTCFRMWESETAKN